MRLFYFLIFALTFAACTIQKRTVNRGYFVQWHLKPKAGKTIAPTQNYPPAEITALSEDTPAGSGEDEPINENSIPEESEKPQHTITRSDNIPGIKPPARIQKKPVKEILRDKLPASTTSFEKTDDEEDPDVSSTVYVLRGVWNILLIGLMIFGGVMLIILLVFTGDFWILLLMLLALHISVMSFYKALSFFKMARIKRRAETDPHAGEDAAGQFAKYKHGRRIIHLVFLAMFLLLLAGLLIKT